MKSKVNWKRVTLITVIAVAFAWVYVFGIPNPKRWVTNPKRWGLSCRLIDLGYKVHKWELGEFGLEVDKLEHLFVDWDSYQWSGRRILIVHGQDLFRPWWAWNTYEFIPDKGGWRVTIGDVIITPDSPMYQQLEEIRKKLILPEVEDE